MQDRFLKYTFFKTNNGHFLRKGQSLLIPDPDELGLDPMLLLSGRTGPLMSLGDLRSFSVGVRARGVLISCTSGDWRDATEKLVVGGGGGEEGRKTALFCVFVASPGKWQMKASIANHQNKAIAIDDIVSNFSILTKPTAEGPSLLHSMVLIYANL